MPSHTLLYVLIYCVSCILFEVKVLSEGVLWDLLFICSVVSQPQVSSCCICLVSCRFSAVIFIACIKVFHAKVLVQLMKFLLFTRFASSSIEKFKYFAKDEFASVSVELIRIYCCMSSL